MSGYYYFIDSGEIKYLDNKEKDYKIVGGEKSFFKTYFYKNCDINNSNTIIDLSFVKVLKHLIKFNCKIGFYYNDIVFITDFVYTRKKNYNDIVSVTDFVHTRKKNINNLPNAFCKKNIYSEKIILQANKERYKITFKDSKEEKIISNKNGLYYKNFLFLLSYLATEKQKNFS